MVAVTSEHEICGFGKHFHGNSELHQLEMSLLHYRIVGSVVPVHDIVNKTRFSYNLQDHIPTFHNLLTRSKSTLDEYDIFANNQNFYAEYKWHFHFRDLTVELYTSYYLRTSVYMARQ